MSAAGEVLAVGAYEEHGAGTSLAEAPPFLKTYTRQASDDKKINIAVLARR